MQSFTHLVHKPKSPQKVRPHLYSGDTPHGHLRGGGGYKISEDFQAFEARWSG